MHVLSEKHSFSSDGEFTHLFEISLPKKSMLEKKIDWSVRDEVSHGGTLLVGDLLVQKHATSVVETHPFPEWVVQLHQFGVTSGKVYAILPKLTVKQVKTLYRKDLAHRKQKTQAMLAELSSADFLAIEYQVGLCLKIPANIPHEFISVVSPREVVPYCHVFEPNFASMAEIFKFNLTEFYQLSFELALELSLN